MVLHLVSGVTSTIPAHLFLQTSHIAERPASLQIVYASANSWPAASHQDPEVASGDNE